MISTRTRIMYGTGGAVYAAKEAAYTMFVLLFYTQVLGLSGTVTGLIIALSLVWDGISDPMVGSLSDRLRSRWGRRHPFMVFSIIPLGLGFIGLFGPPQVVVDSTGLLPAWLLFWSLWVRTFVTTFSIPHLALSAEITSNYHHRSQILGARMAFIFLFSVLLPAAALMFIFPTTDGIDGRFVSGNYPLYGALSCAVVWLTATITCTGTRQHIHSSRDASVSQGDTGSLKTLLRDLSRTLQNSTFRLVLAYEFAAMASYGAVASLNMLVWTYYWQFSAREISLILSAPSLLAIILVLVTLKPLSRRFPKHRLMQFSLVGMILDCLWLYPPQMAGLLPADNRPLMFALNFVFMMIFMYCFLLRGINTQSVVADLTDEHELEHGLRQEAGFFSMINFVIKSATVVGPLYGGIALDVIGLSADMRPGAVPDSTLSGLVFALGLGVIPPLLVALALACKISMSEEKVSAIQAAINQRHLSQS